MRHGETSTERAQTASPEQVRDGRRTGHQGTRSMAWHRRLVDVLRATALRAGRCQVFAHSGNIAFRGLFALFPAIIALLWLLRVVRSERLVSALLTLTDAALPHTASEPIRQVLTDAPRDQTSGAFTLGAVAALAAAGWSLASMTRAMMNGLNAIYGVAESRPFWRSSLVSLVLAAAVSVLLVVALFLVVFGMALAREAAAAIGWGPLVQRAWQLAVWPVLTLLVLCACGLIYYAAPDVQQRPQWVSMGAASATALWLLFSVLYSIYMNRFASYEDVYGAVAGIIVLMAYGYTTAFILLLGAVLNQVLEERQPEGKHAGEHRPGRQPRRR